MSDWGDISGGWDFKKPTSETETASSYEFSERITKLNTKAIQIHERKVRALRELTPLPKPGEQYLIVTDKCYNALTFIDFILNSETPKFINMAVYRINQFAVQHIAELLDRFPDLRIRVVVSNFFNSNKRAEAWAESLKRMSEENDRIDVAFCHSHAKVFCCLTEKGAHYVFEGSGNLSDNARIEQYRYENNREVYEFHSRWIIDLINIK